MSQGGKGFKKSVSTFASLQAQGLLIGGRWIGNHRKSCLRTIVEEKGASKRRVSSRDETILETTRNKRIFFGLVFM